MWLARAIFVHSSRQMSDRNNTVTEHELELFIRQQGYDYLTVWRLVREIRLRHECGVARTKNDRVGRLLRELGIDPARIAFEPVYSDEGNRGYTGRRYRAPIKPTNKTRPNRGRIRG
jgi:hypothetical protein